ncbi:hypothetical protein [Burkholderia gladioli]|uniref:hypothetical protein n=1 Tax=Burkholderia gladioli TaxID=28095 RepID=UPI00163F6320|nr:hypothetical protein [Burkholderia gladioli]
MNRQALSARKYLIEQWNEVTGALSKLSTVAEVRPDSGENVFTVAGDQAAGVIAFDLNPVVFNLPERADDLSTDLFIVVAGRLGILADSVRSDSILLTHDFSTKAAYFRRTRNALVHVYGAHYDFALSELGHPTFHMQLRSFGALASYVKEQYRVDCEVKDSMDGVLRNVRLPCAQMDFFSFFTQLCADHLLFKDSGKEERAAFNHLLKKGSFLKGAGSRSGRLVEEAARACYRAGHWYPMVV